MSTVNWQKILDLSDDDIQTLRCIGYSYVKQGHYQIAKLIFESLLIISEEEEYDLQILGAIHLELNNNKEALQYLEQALQKNPDHAPTLLNRTKALLFSGYKSSGIQLAQRLQLNSNSIIASQASALLLAYK